MTRVLLVGDAGRPTGFERVVRAVGTGLQESGRYEVTVRGLGLRTGDQLKVDKYPFEVKPASDDAQDLLGVKQFAEWVEEDRPDVVLFVQDIWNQLHYLVRSPVEVPKIGYYPIDTPNLKWSFALAAAALDEAIPYTRFGANETALGMRDAVDLIDASRETYGIPKTAKVSRLEFPRDGHFLPVSMERLAKGQNLSGYAPIAHGGQPEKFYPQDKPLSRKALGLPEDAFIVLSVNTNQFRKRQDITIRAFAKLKERVPNAMLVLHCAGGNERSGWDLAQLARLYGVQESVLCTHWMLPELTEAQLRTLYTSADVHVNNGGGEGWGLSTHESALCGIAQVVPNWSATGEVWDGAAMLLPVRQYRFEPQFLNTAHACVEPDDLAGFLIYLAQNPTVLKAQGELARARALQLPTWKQVGDSFVERVDQVLQRPALTPMTLDEVIEAREGVLDSPLRGII